MFDTGPHHDKLPWRTPAWAKHIIQLCQEILQNQEKQMATEQDLQAALQQLFSVVDTAVSALQNAPTNPDGSIPAADVQGIIDQINAERDKANAALQNPTPPPSASA